RDDYRFARGPTLRLLEDLIRETGDPVGGLGALSHDRHVLLSARAAGTVARLTVPFSQLPRPPRKRLFTGPGEAPTGPGGSRGRPCAPPRTEKPLYPPWDTDRVYLNPRGERHPLHGLGHI